MARMVSRLCLNYKGVFAEHFSWDRGMGNRDWQPVWEASYLLPGV